MALARMCKAQPETVADRLGLVLTTAENGSVIAKDQAIALLASLRSVPDHADFASKALFHRLRSAVIHQPPNYAEITFVRLLPGECAEFVSILDTRLTERMPKAKRRHLQ